MRAIHIFIIALLALTACDTIGEDERWTPPTRVEVHKNVLIEDFTGQNCVNCPNASALIHSLQASAEGSHIIAVSIHGGPMGLQQTVTPAGLGNDWGADLIGRFGPNTYPSGMVDRAFVGGQQLLDYTSWTSAAVESMVAEPWAYIDAAATFSFEFDESVSLADNIQGYVSVSATVNPNPSIFDIGVALDPKAVMADWRIHVFLTEDSLTRMQLLPDGTLDRAYVHQHVLRDVLTGSVDGATFTPDEPQEFSGVIPWGYGRAASYEQLHSHPQNMHAVVFVTDDSGGVVQCEQVPLIPLIGN